MENQDKDCQSDSGESKPGTISGVYNPFYHATELDKQFKYEKSQKIYLELLNEFFGNSVICAALGMNYSCTGQSGLAMVLLERALSRIDHIMSDFKQIGIFPKGEKGIAEFVLAKKAEILNAIGSCYKQENRVEEARKYFEDAQKLIPLNPDIQNNLGSIHINDGHPEKAIAFFEKALSVEKDHAQALWNSSLAYLEMGEYEKGWPLYRYGFPANVRAERNYAKDPVPEWDGTPGKKLVVYGEQGIGDEIMFASCLRDVIEDSESVVFDCHKKLHTLFCNSFKGIDIFPTREDPLVTWPVYPDGTKRYEFDAKIAIGDLPRYYRLSQESIEESARVYIEPTMGAIERARALLYNLPEKPNVGISWVGGHKRTRIEVRSIDLESLVPILKNDAVNWISMQYTDCDKEVELLEKNHGIKVHHWKDLVASNNYDDTAGLAHHLDLVITVCTSLVHLCGAMGVPTWVLTPSRPAWRYRLDLDYMPWYSNVSLFRQERDSTDWKPVIETVANELKELTEAVNNADN